MGKHSYIYALELEYGFGYAGDSKHTQTRIAIHVLGSGAKRTGLHKPTRVV